MSTESEKVKAIIRDVFDFQKPIEDSYRPTDIEGWDSIGHVKLILRLEKEMNINFSIDELIEMETVGKMVAVIDRKLAS